MARVSGVQRDSLLVKERVPMAIKGRSERGKSENSSTRSAKKLWKQLPTCIIKEVIGKTLKAQKCKDQLVTLFSTYSIQFDICSICCLARVGTILDSVSKSYWNFLPWNNGVAASVSATGTQTRDCVISWGCFNTQPHGSGIFLNRQFTERYSGEGGVSLGPSESHYSLRQHFRAGFVNDRVWVLSVLVTLKNLRARIWTVSTKLNRVNFKIFCHEIFHRLWLWRQKMDHNLNFHVVGKNQTEFHFCALLTVLPIILKRSHHL